MRLLSIVFAGSLLAGACFLLPERYALNAPLGNLLFGAGIDTPPDVFRERVRVPRGFSIGVFARGIPARLLCFTPSGDLLVSDPRSGRVVRLAPDADGDGHSDARDTLLEGLDRPHGLDVQGDWLYVAESGAIGRARLDPESGQLAGPYQRLIHTLPKGGRHWSRTLRVGGDGWLYVSVGSSCNACEEEDPRRAAILRYRLDGSGEEIYASGLRNAVGFDWRPDGGGLYATDNGRDHLGDDFPPCELNRIERGAFYGWPYANGDRVPDPDWGPGREERIRTSLPPSHSFGAHTAPLGIAFVRADRLPSDYRGAALVALHGSWNRTRKSGYKVVSLHWRPDGSIEERDFAWGFERDEDVIGRPVDVAEGPDGAIYVSDDYAQAIYRITYEDS